MTISFNTLITVLTLSIFSASAFAETGGDNAHAASPDHGMVVVKSHHSVKKTADKLEKILSKKGMTVFARINHSAGAKKVGKTLRPTELVVFGNPKVGTPLMQCAHSVAIDLPQKMLIWEDEKGVVRLGYNDPQYLVQRHSIDGCKKIIVKITGALKKFSIAATQ